MNLADWLKGDHEPREQLKAVESLCRTVAGHSDGGSLVLDPARIPVDSDGACRPEEGRGTPTGRYRAPETVEGQPATAQGQVYTVGVLCFEILASRPFEVRGGPLLRDLRPDLPRDFADAVQACLEMDAEWRPKDLSYVLGQVEGLVASGPSARTPSRGARVPSSPSAAPSRTGRRGVPAPRPWPLLAFALVALALSLASAFYRLRQPSEATPIPPVTSSLAPATTLAAVAPPVSGPGPLLPGAAAAPSTEALRRGATPPPSASREPAALASAPPAGTRPAASVTPVREPSPPHPVTAATPGAAASAAPARVASAPVPTPAAPAAASPAEAAPVEPAGPAAVTSVSPPLLHRSATVLVDVHGIGFRSDHQVRTGHGKDVARGIDVVRQRYVGPTLLQVLLHVDPAAATGAYVLFLVDGAGHATNTRPLEIAR
jgi:hypothetical protein